MGSPTPHGGMGGGRGAGVPQHSPSGPSAGPAHAVCSSRGAQPISELRGHLEHWGRSCPPPPLPPGRCTFIMDAALYVELLMLRICSAKRFTVGTGGIQQTPQQRLQLQSRNPQGWRGRKNAFPRGIKHHHPRCSLFNSPSNRSEHTALQQQCWQSARGNQQNKTRSGSCLGSGLCLQLW